MECTEPIGIPNICLYQPLTQDTQLVVIQPQAQNSLAAVTSNQVCGYTGMYMFMRKSSQYYSQRRVDNFSETVCGLKEVGSQQNLCKALEVIYDQFETGKLRKEYSTSA